MLTWKKDSETNEYLCYRDHIYGLEREREKLSEKVLAAERALMDSTPRKYVQFIHFKTL